MKTVLILSVIGLFFVYPAPARADSRKAMEPNGAGYEAYCRKDYEKALGFFQKAMEEDPASVYPYHNAACVLALTYTSHRSEKISDIIAYLEKTLELDKSRIEKILEDGDLDAVRSEPAFIDFMLSGRGFNDEFYSMSASDYCPNYEFVFTDTGFVMMTVRISADTERWTRTGRYALRGGDIILYVAGYTDVQPVERCVWNEGGITREDDFLWGKMIDGRPDLEAEGFLLSDRVCPCVR
ncbi:MAG: tetratricopeptide repeat protein [Spirochaetales bacterium]|nr:tetratricopeptide repeat protein [Spirochaetales bacterium]